MLSNAERSNFLALLDRAVQSDEGGLRVTSVNRAALRRILLEVRKDREESDPIQSLQFIVSPLSEDDLFIVTREFYEQVKAQKNPSQDLGGRLAQAQSSLSNRRVQPGGEKAGE